MLDLGLSPSLSGFKTNGDHSAKMSRLLLIIHCSAILEIRHPRTPPPPHHSPTGLEVVLLNISALANDFPCQEGTSVSRFASHLVHQVSFLPVFKFVYVFIHLCILLQDQYKVRGDNLVLTSDLSCFVCHTKWFQIRMNNIEQRLQIRMDECLSTAGFRMEGSGPMKGSQPEC